MKLLQQLDEIREERKHLKFLCVYCICPDVCEYYSPKYEANWIAENRKGSHFAYIFALPSTSKDWQSRICSLFFCRQTLQMDKRKTGQWRIERQQIVNIIQNEHSWKSYCLALTFNLDSRRGKNLLRLCYSFRQTYLLTTKVFLIPFTCPLWWKSYVSFLLLLFFLCNSKGTVRQIWHNQAVSNWISKSKFVERKHDIEWRKINHVASNNAIRNSWRYLNFIAEYEKHC